MRIRHMPVYCICIRLVVSSGRGGARGNGPGMLQIRTARRGARTTGYVYCSVVSCIIAACMMSPSPHSARLRLPSFPCLCHPPHFNAGAAANGHTGGHDSDAACGGSAAPRRMDMHRPRACGRRPAATYVRVWALFAAKASQSDHLACLSSVAHVLFPLLFSCRFHAVSPLGFAAIHG
jgi:hypothetical protein